MLEIVNSNGVHMTDLSQARREAATRFYAIGMSCLPQGYTYKFRKSLTGSHDGRAKHINGPKPVTRKALYVWLHECGHAQLGHNGSKPSHVKEWEAEVWAHQTMRAHGIPVPKEMTKRAKAYVARTINRAILSGAKNIDRKARAFASNRSKK